MTLKIVLAPGAHDIEVGIYPFFCIGSCSSSSKALRQKKSSSSSSAFQITFVPTRSADV